MSHDHIDVRYTAKLARLDLTEEEVGTFQTQLESIMEHVESLSAVELPDDLELDDNSHLARMRDDLPQDSLTPEAVLQNAPDQSQSMIRVPKVVADA
jgi:aspartyl-tRNA(Asn)/glutamyl-tRNA(Gln) amidotransferase subunit C